MPGETPVLRVTGKSELICGGIGYRCVIGERGFTATHREGDRATPLGSYPLRECWYRADKIIKPETGLPLKIIRQDDGWCDDPTHPDYNKRVKLPFAASHEKLWRDDDTYDLIVPIGFNDDPVVPGKGSAIFLHLAKPGYPPTLGCVALSLPHMLEVLKRLDRDSRIVIAPES
jgi:L,D-peptidoglycan transpeptidase YkuD (ErfK/YbiS/YcfS/YnhG family)